jgi:hypothetical protein
VVLEDGQLIHLQGLAKLLLLRVLEGSAFLEADEHQVVPMGEGQGLPCRGDLGGGRPEALISFKLTPLQNHQIPLSRPPELKVEDLAGGEAAGFEKGAALFGQAIQVITDFALHLEGSGQGAFRLPFQGLPKLPHGFEAKTEPGGHQLLAFRKGARSMPKICPMASMAW